MNESKDQNHSVTILIVEDDKISQALFREILKSRGYKLYFAKNGAETIDYLNSNSLPNLILMDVRLPDITGIELSSKIIKQFPESIIIAQTAFANMSIEKECFAVGIKGFITKPLNTMILLKVIDQYLK